MRIHCVYMIAILIQTITVNTASAQKTDSIKIMELLKADYKTMVGFNIEAHKKNCTEDYLLIENGEIWDMAREAADYKMNAHRKFIRNDFFTMRSMKIYKDIAYTVYGLRSEIIENNMTRVKTWNESAVFRKVNGQWKIALIHSTPVEMK